MATQIEVNAATEFINSCPAFGQYNTEENIAKIWAYITGAWPNSNAADLASSYEIAFRDLVDKGKLTPIPNWTAPLTQEERDRVRNASAAETKEWLRKDPEFKRAFELIAEEELVERKACEADPWRWMTREQYNSFEPISKARLYAENENFRRSVQRLIDRGEI